MDRHGNVTLADDLSSEQRLFSLLQRFEEAWRSASDGKQAPDVEEYLQRSGAEASPTLRHLLEVIDRAYRVGAANPSAQPHTRSFSDTQTLDSQAGKEAILPFLLQPPQRNVHDEADTASLEQSPPSDVTGAWSPKEAEERHLEFSFDNDGVEATYLLPDSNAASSTGAGIESQRLQRQRAAEGPLPTIPGYDVVALIGRGGMGVVYLARQVGLKRLVALKMILGGDHAGEHELHRFQAEAEAAAQLHHPNIVQIYEIGWQEQLPYFSLEFIDGPSLEAERAGKPMAPVRAAELVRTIAQAMHHAHQKGIIHRDLKPSNVLLTRSGVPKIADFGLVKRLEGDATHTATGALMGTPAYMAPEQASGKSVIGPAADVYAIGSILYTLLTGRPPFLGPTPVDTVMQVLHNEPVAPSRLQPKIPLDVQTICLKCLQKDPARRYSSAADLADDLDRFLANKPILARPVGYVERTTRWCRRNPSLAAASVAALVLALCLMIGGPLAALAINEKKQLAEQSELAAIAATGLAKKNEATAVENAEKFKRAQEQADENADLAGEQRDLAVDSLNTLVEHVQDEIRDLPQTQPLKRKLLTAAMDGLNRVSESQRQVDLKNLVMARAHRKLGDSLLQTGQFKEALDQYQRCYAIVAAQAETPNPAKPDVAKLNLGRIYLRLGKATERLEGLQAAKDYYLLSLRVREEALPLTRDKLFCKQEIAESLGHLGSVSLAQGFLSEARGYMEQAIDLRKEWAGEASKNIENYRELAGAHTAVGQVSLNLGDIQKAIQHFEQSLARMQAVSNVDGDSVNTRGNTALGHMNLGTAHLFAEQSTKAAEYYEAARKSLDEISREDFQNAAVKQKLSDAHYGLAVSLLEIDKKTANEHFQHCLRIRQGLADAQKDDLRMQEALMIALARCGKDADAVAICEKLLERFPNRSGTLYQTALCYSVCAGAVADRIAGGDESQKLADLRQEYVRKAVETARLAVKHGYEAKAMLKLDPDFKPIRALPEFQKLCDDVGAPQPASTPAQPESPHQASSS